MKKGIEIWSDYDEQNHFCLRCKKAKGRFTLDEIVETATGYMEDVYAVIIKAVGEDAEQYFDYLPTGDYVTLYPAEDFFKRTTAEVSNGE